MSNLQDEFEKYQDQYIRFQQGIQVNNPLVKYNTALLDDNSHPINKTWKTVKDLSQKARDEKYLEQQVKIGIENNRIKNLLQDNSGPAIYTGSAGMNMFNQAMQESANDNFLGHRNHLSEIWKNEPNIERIFPEVGPGLYAQMLAANSGYTNITIDSLKEAFDNTSITKTELMTEKQYLDKYGEDEKYIAEYNPNPPDIELPKDLFTKF